MIEDDRSLSAIASGQLINQKIVGDNSAMVASSTEENILKLKGLIATASNPRQQTMYQKLLQKAIKQRDEEKRSSLRRIDPEPIRESAPPAKVSANKSKKKSLGSKKASTTEILVEEEKSAVAVLPGESSTTNCQSSPEEQSHLDPEQEQKAAIFQAIGVIEGRIEKGNNSRLSITLEGQKYPLGYTAKSRKRSYQVLLEELAPEISLVQKVLVYPNCNHHGKKGPSLSFNLVAVEKIVKEEGIFSELAPGEFRLSGFWQYVPFCDSPCLTILRNYNEGLAKTVKKMARKKASLFLKANYIPLEWSDSPIEAFKYNPEAEKSEQMPRYFVQVTAKLKAEAQKLVVIEQRGIPTTSAPKYLKK